jgi:hypothetical protein
MGHHRSSGQVEKKVAEGHQGRKYGPPHRAAPDGQSAIFPAESPALEAASPGGLFHFRAGNSPHVERV